MGGACGNKGRWGGAASGRGCGSSRTESSRNRGPPGSDPGRQGVKSTRVPLRETVAIPNPELKFMELVLFQFSSVVSDSATPWTAARHTSLFITNSRSLVKLMSIESVMPSNHLILCHPLLCLPSIFPSIRVFSNESVLRIRWPYIGVSTSASVLPMNIQG